jgi:hypothetical protein
MHSTALVAYLSLLEKQRAQHTQWLQKKKGRETVSMCFGHVTHWKQSKESKENMFNEVERILWKNCV